LQVKKISVTTPLATVEKKIVANSLATGEKHQFKPI
jgi:hypothetical protein